MKNFYDKLCQSSKRAFTVAEVTVAMAIAAVISLGVVQLTILLGNVTFDSREKVEVAEKIRTFTSNLSNDGRGARQLILFPGMPEQRSDLNRSFRLSDGQTGDVAVFIHVEPEPIQNAEVGLPQRFYLKRMIVFARAAAPGELGPVLRYEIREGVHFNLSQEIDDAYVIRDDPSDTMIGDYLAEMLIPGASGTLLSRNASVSEVVELSRGLANGSLFRNFRDNSLVVNGEIVEGNDARQVTNTYNFTITRQG